MSVYSGFATRQQETYYNRLVEKLILLLSDRIIKASIGRHITHSVEETLTLLNPNGYPILTKYTSAWSTLKNANTWSPSYRIP
jgi:hypothetical protein